MKAKASKPERYVTEKTFEKAMAGIAKTLAHMAEKNNKNTELILQEIRAGQLDNKRHSDTLSSLQKESTGYDRRLDNHELRIEKLEAHASTE